MFQNTLVASKYSEQKHVKEKVVSTVFFPNFEAMGPEEDYVQVGQGPRSNFEIGGHICDSVLGGTKHFSY